MVRIADPNPTARPLAHLAAAARRYPEAWKWYDRFRADRGSPQLGNWPEWCFCPLSGAYAVVSGGRPLADLDRAQHIGTLGALAAWRPAQGVYVIDETILDALLDTPCEGDIPVEVLYHLPEWCVWIALPGRELVGPTGDGHAVEGFFASLEYDANDGRSELRLAVDFGGAPFDELVPVPLHLGVGSLADAVAAAFREAGKRIGVEPALGASAPGFAAALAPLVSVVLYLCTEAAEIRPTPGCPAQPGRPAPIQTRREGWRLFPPDRPRVWRVGDHLGEQLRRADADEAQAREAGAGRASPRPHVRRAHWHTFWTGPRAGTRVPKLRWLPPIAVSLVEDPPAAAE